MPDTPSITINHRFTYRGQPEIWSNTYHFSGTTPATDAEWLTLCNAIFDTYKAALVQDVKMVGYLGYAAGNEHAVSIKDHIADGTTPPNGTYAGSWYAPSGDVALWVRWRLPTRNSRGKWNYLRKYLHGVPTQGDGIETATRTVLGSYATKMKDGTLPGGFKIVGEQGAEAGAHKVAPNVTFRQLKRTGRRPSTSSQG